jgi:hypothetical protein
MSNFDGPVSFMPAPSDITASDHLSPYISRIDECAGELNDLRVQIEVCVKSKQPVERDLKQKTNDCLAMLRQLQINMKHHNAVHRESKRIVRRSCAQETKYEDSKSQSTGSLLIKSSSVSKRRDSQWFQSPQINALENRVNNRVRKARGRFRSKERLSPL